MRLLLVATRFPRPSHTFIVGKLEGLLDAGWDVHIACREPGPLELFPSLAARPDMAGRVHATEDLDALVGALDPDLVHLEFHMIAWAPIPTTGVPTIISYRGIGFARDVARHREIWERVSAVHAVSEAVCALLNRLGCPPSLPVELITDGIDITFFSAPDRELPASVGTALRPLRILSTVRLDWTKGLPYMLDAVARVRSAGHACEYRIVGPTAYVQAEHETKYCIWDLGLGDVATLVGQATPLRVREELLWADVFLHGSVSDGLPHAVIEAQAMSLPVVCSDAGGLPEIVVDGETGFVVPRRDADALATKVAVLAGDPNLRRRLGQAGRRRVEAHFALTPMVERWMDFYQRVAHGRTVSHPDTLE